MKRKRFSYGDFVRILIGQGCKLICPKCGEPIDDHSNICMEHVTPLALGGADDFSNVQLWHKRPCSFRKTNGQPHTSYGSDAHAIAKVRRMNKPPSASKQRIKAANAAKRAWAKRIKAERAARNTD